MEADGEALAQLHAGPMVAEAVGEFQPEGLGIEADGAVHIGDVESDVAAGEHMSSVVRHAECRLFSLARARLTFSKMSAALAVHMKGLGA